jgi:hypothetical protein
MPQRNNLLQRTPVNRDELPRLCSFFGCPLRSVVIRLLRQSLDVKLSLGLIVNERKCSFAK